MLDVTRLIWRRWKGRHPTGIDRVCLAYVRHFGPRAQAVVQHDRFRRILDRSASQRLFALLDAPPSQFRRKLPGAILRHLGGLNRSGDHRLYLNVGHTGLDLPGLRAWLSRSTVRPVYLVHDLIPITHPALCRPEEANRHRERMRTVLTTAAGVIGNSQATLDDLAGFARREGLPNPPSLAAWLGSDPLPRPEPRPSTDRPTFVILGTIEARKNHQLLLGIWRKLVAQLGCKAPRLLVIGQRGWEAEHVFDVLDRDDRLRGHVVELNACSDEQLAQHLGSARALLFPSLAEGYGLPLVEALGMGVPVIASDLPVFREIGGDIPIYLNPLDAAAWEAAISDYARPESPARAKQIERMTAFKSFGWDAHFDAVERWLAWLG